MRPSDCEEDSKLKCNGNDCGDVKVEEERVRIAPDGGWGWVVVAGSFLIQLVADGISYSFGVIIQDLLVEFEGGKGPTSWILSILIGLSLVVGPLASALTNRFGCRKTAMIGALIGALGCFLSYFGSSVFSLIITMGGITGLGFGLMYCPAIIIVTIYFDKRRSLATGLSVAGSGLGTLIFPPITAYLIDQYTWRGTFFIYSGIILNCLICGALFRAAPTGETVWTDRKKGIGEGGELEMEEGAAGSRSIVDLLRILKNPLFIIFAISNFLTSVGMTPPLVFLPDRAVQLGLDNDGALLSIYGLFNTLGRLVVGWMSDRPWANRLLIYSVFVTAAGISTILFFLCTSFRWLALYAGFYGVALSGYINLTSVILVDLVGLDLVTNAFGIMLMVQGVASFLGPPIAGTIADITGSYDGSFYFAGVLLLISGLILFPVPYINCWWRQREE